MSYVIGLKPSPSQNAVPSKTRDAGFPAPRKSHAQGPNLQYNIHLSGFWHVRNHLLITSVRDDLTRLDIPNFGGQQRGREGNYKKLSWCSKKHPDFWSILVHDAEWWGWQASQLGSNDPTSEIWLGNRSWNEGTTAVIHHIVWETQSIGVYIHKYTWYIYRHTYIT